MAFCPNCNSEIELNAILCNSCSYDFPDRNPYVEDSPYQIGLKSILVLLALISIALSIIYSAYIAPARAAEALEASTERLGGEMYVTNLFTFISFKNQPITDIDLAPLIPLMRKCPNLHMVDLSGTLITDESIELLDSLPEELQSRVNLAGTAVTNSGRLRVGGLRVTDPELIDALNRLSESSD